MTLRARHVHLVVAVQVETIRKIGEGSFGEVLLGNFRGTKVAVKRECAITHVYCAARHQFANSTQLVMRGLRVPVMYELGARLSHDFNDKLHAVVCTVFVPAGMRGFEMGDDGDPGPSPTMMPVFAQFFEREIEIMATIRHPNVVNFIGACHTPPNVCLVTEYCARGSLVCDSVAVQWCSVAVRWACRLGVAAASCMPCHVTCSCPRALQRIARCAAAMHCWPVV